MKAKATLLRAAALALLAAAALSARAGGPLDVCNNAGVKYPGTVTLNYDTGTTNNALGPLSKSSADALVTSSVALWTNVPTSNVVIARGPDLGVDVTIANYTTYLNHFTDGLNPIIYDTDGSITDDLLGPGASNSVLGFAGSAAYGPPTCLYAEGQGVISGKLLTQGVINSTTMSITLAHEVGHLIGMDHSQIDSEQGVASSDRPLMYPVASRNTLTLSADDAAAVSDLYPDATFGSTYGQVSGNLRLADGVTPVLGANVWARETTTGAVYSVVSDFLMQNTGYFRLSLPAGTYTLQAGAIHGSFTGGSSVGPYSETSSSASFAAPLWVSGTPMTAVTLGGAAPMHIVVTPGCTGAVTFNLSGTGSVTGSCSRATPSITLGSSLNPATAGQAVTFTGVVSGASGTPTGTIVFRDNGVAISGCAGLAMTSGRAACSPMLSAGTHQITAVYSGDATYNAITSSTLPQVMNGATPTVSLATSRNPSNVGDSVSFSASVSGSSGTPTGSVNFLDGTTSISGCSAVSLASGSAACSTSTLVVGTHAITAAYSGNTTYNPRTSAVVSQTVASPTTPTTPSAPGTASITLGSTANPSTVGQYVTYTAVVFGSSGTPTGTIVFRDNGTAINGCGGLVMTNGRATCTIGNQALGTHSMTAAYSGDGVYSAGSSSTLPQVVNPAKPNTPSITLGSSVNPSTVGQYVELTAVVSGGAGTPTGTLVFLDNGDAIGGCGGIPMVNGQATCTPGSLTLGTHSITTVYSGDGAYNGVTSSTLPQTVNPAKPNTPSFTLGSSLNPSTAGQRVTFTAVLSGVAGTPTGNVVFRDNGVTIAGCGGLALTNGSVSCAPALSSVGTHAITGIYLGDGNYNGITSGTVPQVVQ